MSLWIVIPAIQAAKVTQNEPLETHSKHIWTQAATVAQNESLGAHSSHISAQGAKVAQTEPVETPFQPYLGSGSKSSSK